MRKYEECEGLGFKIIEGLNSEYLHCCEDVKEEAVEQVMAFLKKRREYSSLKNRCEECSQILEHLYGRSSGKSTYPNGDGILRDINIEYSAIDGGQTLPEFFKDMMDFDEDDEREPEYDRIELFFWAWLYEEYLDSLRDEIVNKKDTELFTATRLVINTQCLLDECVAKINEYGMPPPQTKGPNHATKGPNHATSHHPLLQGRAERTIQTRQ